MVVETLQLVFVSHEEAGAAGVTQEEEREGGRHGVLEVEEDHVRVEGLRLPGDAEVSKWPRVRCEV